MSAQNIRINSFITRGCIGTAIGVFGAWNYADRGATYNVLSELGPSIPKPNTVAQQLREYFLLKADDPKNLLSWIGSSFSHKDPVHCAFNLLALWSFAPMLSRLPTPHFAALIFGSSIVASATWLYERRVVRKTPYASALGSSGIVSGVLATCTMFAPTLPVRTMLFVPMPLWTATVGYFLIDSYAMRSGKETGVGHAAHIGGGVFGVVYYLVFLRRYGGIFGKRLY